MTNRVSIDDNLFPLPELQQPPAASSSTTPNITMVCNKEDLLQVLAERNANLYNNNNAAAAVTTTNNAKRLRQTQVTPVPTEVDESGQQQHPPAPPMKKRRRFSFSLYSDEILAPVPLPPPMMTSTKEQQQERRRQRKASVSRFLEVWNARKHQHATAPRAAASGPMARIHSPVSMTAIGSNLSQQPPAVVSPCAGRAMMTTPPATNNLASHHFQPVGVNDAAPFSSSAPPPFLVSPEPARPPTSTLSAAPLLNASLRASLFAEQRTTLRHQPFQLPLVQNANNNMRSSSPARLAAPDVSMMDQDTARAVLSIQQLLADMQKGARNNKIN